MKTRNKAALMVMVLLTLSGLALMLDSGAADARRLASGPRRLVLNLIGKGEMYIGTVPDIDGDEIDDEAMCFDVDLVDLASNQTVGTATDCLSMVADGENGGLALVGTSFFNLPNGQIVTRGNTTVQPVNWPTASNTHITGANGTENAILSGTGPYLRATGPVRLSGLVDLSEFTGEVGTPITFDCVFVIDIDEPNRSQR